MEQPPLKRIRSERSPAGSENDGTVQSRENPVDSNIYLTYDILRIVFRYLNGRDLASAAMVCRLWLEAANNEKCTRSPHCFMEYYKPPVSLNGIKDSKIKPSIGFFFIPENTPLNIEGYILDLLPQNCVAIMLYTSGIVMNNIEMEYHAFPNIVCAFLPQIPNVTINAFKVTEQYLLPILQSGKRSRTVEYQEFIKVVDETSIPNHDRSTCLMLFCNYSGHHRAMLFASTIQKSQEDGITSLWGGVVEDVYIQHIHSNNPYARKKELISGRRNPYCLAVLITGPIQTWSTVVDKKCRTKEQVEVKLRLFRDQVKLKKHSMGFMFACKARGTNMYNEENNVESTIFKTLFPKVPLVGCFGDGEFGKNTMPVDEMEKKTRSKKKQKAYINSLYNEFSTMFMILTYG